MKIKRGAAVTCETKYKYLPDFYDTTNAVMTSSQTTLPINSDLLSLIGMCWTTLLIRDGVNSEVVEARRNGSSLEIVRRNGKAHNSGVCVVGVWDEDAGFKNFAAKMCSAMGVL